MNELEEEIDNAITRLAEKYGLDYEGEIGIAERSRVRYVAYDKMKDDNFSMFNAIIYAIDHF